MPTRFSEQASCLEEDPRPSRRSTQNPFCSNMHQLKPFWDGQSALPALLLLDTQYFGVPASQCCIAPKPTALGFFHALYALHGTIFLALIPSGWTHFSPGLAVDKGNFSAHFLWVYIALYAPCGWYRHVSRETSKHSASKLYVHHKALLPFTLVWEPGLQPSLLHG